MVSRMKRLKDNKHMLYVLKNARPCLRNAILKTADSEVIKTLCEITLNTLKGNHTPSGKMYNQLCKYKKGMRKLVSAKRSVPRQRKILVQQGGFLPVLLGSVLSGVIGSIIEKYVQK